MIHDRLGSTNAQPCLLGPEFRDAVQHSWSRGPSDARS